MTDADSESTERVAAAARALGLEIALTAMPVSTRTAEEAAAACGCAVDQIVKSLVFQATESGELVLFLISGGHRVDAEKARAAVGEELERADPKRVRAVTGFAIGGVAPIGHIDPPPVYMDDHLLDFETVWAAGGGPQTVFAVAPRALAEATEARVVPLV